MIAFGGLAAIVSTLVAVVCYQVTRTTLTSQREAVAERQTFVNAKAVDNALTSDPAAPIRAISAAQVSAQGFALVQVDGEWFSSSVTGDEADLTPELTEALEAGSPARQRVDTATGTAVAVAVPVAGSAGDVRYVEFAPLSEVERTLNRVRQGLILAAVATTAVGLLAGRWASARMLRPVTRTAEAANRITEGALDRRLESEGDADLEPLVHSFNEMVDGLQTRIEREARFASDVSHELRTPLAAMVASLSVARRRVTEPSGTEALDHLQVEVDRFTSLITDLLEISRVEAGVAELVLEPTDPGVFAREAVASAGSAEIPVVVERSAATEASFDRRRMGQVLTNLLQNAQNYAGGATQVLVNGTARVVRFCVDDAGPGISPDERLHVFERFARGADPSVPGTGLGLALVAEHVRLHGGDVAITTSPDGGARFTVTIPRSQS